MAEEGRNQIKGIEVQCRVNAHKYEEKTHCTHTAEYTARPFIHTCTQAVALAHTGQVHTQLEGKVWAS